MKKSIKAYTLVELVISLALIVIFMAGATVFLIYATQMQGYIQNKDKDFSNAYQFQKIISDDISKNQNQNLTFYTRSDNKDNIKTSGYNNKIFSFDSGSKYYSYNPQSGVFDYYNGTDTVYSYTSDVLYYMSISQVDSLSQIKIGIKKASSDSLILSFVVNISNLTVA
jgi:type II secretory pathway pseudopilin PulG